MVYGFVKQSGGHIKIYSEPGQGTTIRIYLPRARQLEDVETAIETGPAAGGTETVLVAEDDEEVRGTVVDMLSDLGYRVLKAKDAQSALAIIESGVPIDLLFTDVVMPGALRSPELARKAQERLPGIAVLFTSGYTENAIVHDGRLDDGIELLSKPYTREAMARKIRHVLQNRQQRNLARSASSALSQRRVTGDGASVPTRALRVLLVEDDALIRLSAADMLASLGHSVVEAANGRTALDLLDKGLFDVIMTDLALPDMSGEEVAVRAVKQQPGLRVIFATGYASLPSTARRDGLQGAVMLQKPYTEQHIAAALRTAIPYPAAGRRMNPRVAVPDARRSRPALIRRGARMSAPTSSAVILKSPRPETLEQLLTARFAAGGQSFSADGPHQLRCEFEILPRMRPALSRTSCGVVT